MPIGVYKRTKEHNKKLSEILTGRTKSEEHKRKIGKALQEENGSTWKGDKVGYKALHKWVKKKLGTPDSCKHCNKTGLSGRKIHWANKSGRYLRDLSDWIRLCRHCHGKYDSIIKKSWSTRENP